MDAWTLRDAGAADSNFVFRVYAGTRLEELAVTGWSAEQQESFLRMQFAAQEHDYRHRFPSARFSVVHAFGYDVGRLYVDESGDQICVLDIALLPEYRCRGLGSALVRTLLADAVTSGRTVSLHVERNNPALALYRRLGFVDVDEHGIYKLMHWYPPGGNVKSPRGSVRSPSIAA